jgi:WD40 repeat protein
VYLAYDPQLRREVALKVPRGEFLLTPELRARFLREARAAARLDHANVVAVHEVGEVGPFCYIASAYCPGTNLADWLRARTDPVPVRLAASLCATLAGAVQHAHERGVLHRDLKPSNVLLEPAADEIEFVAKVTDFGLAKVPGSEETQQTQTGALLGTPRYMAPEQAEGKSHAIGPAADVYALGVILYELLTGRPPFIAETVLDVLEQVRTHEPVSPARLRARLPRDLETICLKCLQKQPQSRYASAGLLAADLHRFLEGKPILARPVSAGKRLWLWVRRRPAQAALVVVSLVAAMALAGAVVGLAFSLSLDDANQKTQIALAAETIAKHEAERQAERAEGFRYHNLIGQAHAEWRNNDVRRADELLGQCPAALRNWEWHYLYRLCHADLLTVPDHPNEVTAVAYSPDGKTIAAACVDGSLQVCDADTGAERCACRGHTGVILDLAYTPDAKRLISASRDWTVKIWDAATGEEVRTIRNVGRGLALSSDGRLLASRTSNNTVSVIDLVTGETVWSQRMPEVPGDALAFHVDGKQLAVSTRNLVTIWDITTGKAGLQLPGFGGIVYCVAFSPDGRSLAISGSEPIAQVWDAARGQRHQALVGHSLGVPRIAFSPDGKNLATASYDQTVRLWSLGPTRDSRIFKGHTRAASSVAFRPDGKRLASGGRDRAVKVWNLSANPEYHTLAAHHGVVGDLAFSRDGKRLASGGHDGTVKVWDVQSGERAFTFQGLEGWVNGVCFSPDGNLLASSTQIIDNGVGYIGGEVRVWDLRTGEVLLPLKRRLDLSVFGAVWDPSGEHLAVGCQDGSAIIWNAASGKQTLVLMGHSKPVTTVAYSGDGRWIATGGVDGVVKVWDAVTGRETYTFTRHSGGIGAIAFSPDSGLLASGALDGTLKVWDPTSGEEAVAFAGNVDEITGLSFSADGKRLAAANSVTRAVVLWDVSTGQQILALRGHDDTVRRVAFSPDRKCLATADASGRIDLWDGTPAPAPPPSRRPGPPSAELAVWRGHEGAVTSLAYSSDGQWLASGSMDRTVRLWHGGVAAAPLILRGHVQQVWGLAIRRDAKRLAVATGDHEQRKQPGEVKVWDTATGKPALALPVSDGGLYCVAYSPDGARIAAAGWDQVVRVWDADTGQPQAILRGHRGEVWGVAFSPDGKRLASAGFDATIRVWDLPTADPQAAGPVLTLTGHTAPVWAVAFSPDGKLLASAGDDRSVRVWDAASGKEVHALLGHTRTPYAVAFSPDGKQLASASGHRWQPQVSGEIRLCEVASGRLVRGHVNSGAGYFGVAFSPDGRHLAAACMDRSVQVWSLPPDAHAGK